MRDVSLDQETLFSPHVKFWKWSASASRSRDFLGILQCCKMGHFSTFGSHLWKTYQIFTKILLMYFWIVRLDLDQPWRKSALSNCWLMSLFFNDCWLRCCFVSVCVVQPSNVCVWSASSSSAANHRVVIMSTRPPCTGHIGAEPLPILHRHGPPSLMKNLQWFV